MNYSIYCYSLWHTRGKFREVERSVASHSLYSRQSNEGVMAGISHDPDHYSSLVAMSASVAVVRRATCDARKAECVRARSRFSASQC